MMDAGRLKALLAGTAFILSLAVLCAGVARGEESGLERNRRELEKIRQRIEQTSEDLKKKETKGRSLTADLKAVNRALEHSRKRLDDYARQTKKLDAEMTARESDVARIRQRVENLEGQVQKRLVALYKDREMGFVRALFDSGAPARKAEQFDFLTRIVRRDRELLDNYRRQVEELEAALERLTALRREKETLLSEVRREQENLAEARTIKKKLLARVRNDEKTLAARLKDLRDRAKRMSALIKRLESDQATEYTENSGLFASQKGRLPWPVHGPVKVGFGTIRHPDLGTLFDSQGIEIAVPGEQPIAAVWPGRVIFASQFQGYGNLVIVDHGDKYYTLYAQGSRLNKKVGDRVAQGETVAYSGFADSKSVYFEIRHRGKPLDPSDWLATP